MPRRDAFTDLRVPLEESEIDEDSSMSKTNFTKQPLDSIPTAEFSKKRAQNRERAHQSETATYRGIPQQISDLIIEISQGLSVPSDEVVLAFLEYAFRQYRAEQLKIYAYPKGQLMTLFLDRGQTDQITVCEIIEINLWLKDPFPFPAKKNSLSKRKKNKNDQQAKPQWEMHVTIRMPSLLKEEVRILRVIILCQLVKLYRSSFVMDQRRFMRIAYSFIHLQ